MATPTTNSITAYGVDLSGDPFLDSLIYGVRWGLSYSATNLTYSFATPQSSWDPNYSDTNEPAGTIALSTLQRDYFRMALAEWSNVANISFTEVTETRTQVGDIRVAFTTFGEEDSDLAAYAYLPGNFPAAGDIWIGDEGRFDSFAPGSFGFLVALHEVGHALGLKHPFDSDEQNSVTLDEDFDQISYTIMSYDVYPDLRGANYSFDFYPTTPMLLDIAAMQALYGDKLNSNAGNTTYSFNQGSDYFETIFDTGGTDTIVWNATTEGAVIDLEGGYWSDLGNSLVARNQFGAVEKVDPYTVAIYYDSVIENATGGSANDRLLGNEIGNVLDGRAGHDVISGYGGADTLIGGDGNDRLYGRADTGGSDGADSLNGGNGSDYIQGNAGNDTIDGGNGSDRLNGGADNDRIEGGAGNDTINGNKGDDTIAGGEGNDSVAGGQGNDSVSGGAGDDTVSGSLGQDTLTGGAGVDTFVFPFATAGSTLAAPDRITDFADGTDYISLGFAPAVLTGAAQSTAGAAQTLAQQLFDGRVGDREVAAIQVGADTYLFFAANGGNMIDSAVIVAGVSANLFDGGDFV